MSEDLVCRLRKRAEIRLQIATRKSVQEGKVDRIAEVLLEAAQRIEELEGLVRRLAEDDRFAQDRPVGDLHGDAYRLIKRHAKAVSASGDGETKDGV